ncbi:hypothetical protein [Curtobacterium sp. 20TX0008]|uniref:hypothetical protein n=1 Tax=Curtobacterium sp. 20TX0008 TaxID=3022018 RepID=UPI0023308148|nr:hypothetical protein [Curtobacterium sp. 20TX0008]MDB6427459.1 hypothetical protein [Curtobacterium sp. 20TX0008]
MRKRAALKDRPEVAKHLHKHIEVTRTELDAFAAEDDAVQLLVLAELRSRAADRETTLLLTLEGATVAILAVMLSRIPTASPSAAPNRGSGWVGTAAFAIVCAALGAIAVVLAMPSARRAMIGNRDHAQAVVWLGAYEQVLVERRSETASVAASPQPRFPWLRRR